MQNPTIYIIIGMCLKHRKQIYDLHYIHTYLEITTRQLLYFIQQKNKQTKKKQRTLFSHCKHRQIYGAKKINQRIH
jgi:hypothetical protein